jgi:hypothetical protein
LQQFLWITQPVLHRVCIGAKSLRGEQACREGVTLRRIFRDEANLIDTNIRNAGQR